LAIYFDIDNFMEGPNLYDSTNMKRRPYKASLYYKKGSLNESLHLNVNTN